MSDWISAVELWDAFRKEELRKRKLEDLYNERYGTWSEDDMSNRKKIKGLNEMEKREFASDKPSSFAGRFNGYICDTCGKGWLVLDIDEGVTPMFEPCFATEGCRGQAHSMMYPNGEPPAHLGEPIIHWVKPTEKEAAKLSPELRDHVRRGGLVRRFTNNAPAWVRAMA
jgi:hypothetical protein